MRIALCFVCLVVAGCAPEETPRDQSAHVEQLRDDLRAAEERITRLERSLRARATPAFQPAVRQAPDPDIDPVVSEPGPRAFVQAPAPAPAPVAVGVPGGRSFTFTRGPRGGCYTFNDSGTKVYVPHSLCR